MNEIPQPVFFEHVYNPASGKSVKDFLAQIKSTSSVGEINFYTILPHVVAGSPLENHGKRVDLFNHNLDLINDRIKLDADSLKLYQESTHHLRTVATMPFMHDNLKSHFSDRRVLEKRWFEEKK